MVWENGHKAYIDVIAHFKPDGMIIPLRIKWGNSVYNVDKVTEILPRPSKIGGGAGIRYTIYIKARQKYIWLEHGTNKWFVEVEKGIESLYLYNEGN